MQLDDQGIAAAAQRAAANGHAPGAPYSWEADTPGERVPREFHKTDFGNAERLVAAHGRDLRHARGLGWLTWDGRRWRRDDDGEVERRAKQTVRAIYAHAATLDDPDDRKALVQWATRSESQARIAAAIALAESERAIVVRPDDLDAHPFLLNVANGTIDLRTGELREHRRVDLLTKITPTVYDPDAISPAWERFLDRITGGDANLAGFLQRAAGYSLTGDTSEEVLFFAHGPAATGKSTYLEAKRAAFGEFSRTADFESFLARHGDAGVRNDIARLAGARLVVSVEVDEGKRLAEGLLKMLTGGDTVTARFLYSEAFEFQPAFKLWLAANARPRVNADDEGVWRRILQVPFVEVIPEAERDPDLKRELRTSPEAQSAILAWAVRGCLEWQQGGLRVPERVKAYTAEYRSENDPLRDWLADCCVFAPTAYCYAGDLRKSLDDWTDANGGRKISDQDYSAALKARGCTNGRERVGTTKKRVWRGIGLLDEETR